jgi:hypothetical protein
MSMDSLSLLMHATASVEIAMLLRIDTTKLGAAEVDFDKT